MGKMHTEQGEAGAQKIVVTEELKIELINKKKILSEIFKITF